MVQLNLESTLRIMDGYKSYFNYEVSPISLERTGDAGRYSMVAKHDTFASMDDLIPHPVIRFVQESKGRHSILELACRAQINKHLNKLNAFPYRKYHYKVSDLKYSSNGMITFKLERILMAHMRQVKKANPMMTLSQLERKLSV